MNTIQVSLQLSVLGHKNKYGDARPEEMNKLIKLTKEITLQDRRKYELMIKSGVTGRKLLSLLNLIRGSLFEKI